MGAVATLHDLLDDDCRVVVHRRAPSSDRGCRTPGKGSASGGAGPCGNEWLRPGAGPRPPLPLRRTTDGPWRAEPCGRTRPTPPAHSRAHGGEIGRANVRTTAP